MQSMQSMQEGYCHFFWFLVTMPQEYEHLRRSTGMYPNAIKDIKTCIRQSHTTGRRPISGANLVQLGRSEVSDRTWFPFVFMYVITKDFLTYILFPDKGVNFLHSLGSLAPIIPVHAHRLGRYSVGDIFGRLDDRARFSLVLSPVAHHLCKLFRHARGQVGCLARICGGGGGGGA